MFEEHSLWARAARHRDNVAVVDVNGSHTYDQLLEASGAVASAVLVGRSDLGESRIAFLAPPGLDHIAAQWGIWRAGGIAVPLALAHPEPELDYVVEDAGAETIVATAELAPRVEALAARRGIGVLDACRVQHTALVQLPDVAATRRAMMVYTSGTTARPKGVVTTHANIWAQVASLVEAWQWSARDRILGVLPLHHVHGIINVVTCALWSGAACECLTEFDATTTWSRLASGDITLFMAVPTIYHRLIDAWEAAPRARRELWSAGAGRLRLMVSGSMALPVGTLERWREITGHTLLERYGMTEIGMALSNPLHGERRPGFVGTPLPGVEVRRLDEHGDAPSDQDPGEIEVRGPGVFPEYWNRPDATASAFRDGWFRTGDIAVVERGAYRILGRASVDIIKTGGFKVSALEIEEVLRGHDAIRECAVVGIPDDEWGERVAAAVVLEESAALDLATLRAWAKERLAGYKVPSALLPLDALPRNTLGKVTKSRLREVLLGGAPTLESPP